MPIGLNHGQRQEAEKCRHGLVFLCRMALKSPQAGPSDDGVQGRALCIRPVRQIGDAELELRISQVTGVGSRGLRHHPEIAGRKHGIGVVSAPGIDEDLVLLPVGQLLDVLHVQRGIDEKLGIQAFKTVALGANGNVVPGTEVLDLDPGRPAGRKSVFNGA